mgnify:CR=1 FL=1
MKILKYNESVRDLMKPKSEEEIRTAVDTLTPWGMMNKIQMGEFDDKKLEKEAQKKIDKSVKELDEIFESNSKDEDLRKLVPKVNTWIKKYGGNDENMEAYGFTEMAEHIWRSGIQWQHDVEILYDETVFDSFRQLLKNVAKCETKYNNIDYEHY